MKIKGYACKKHVDAFGDIGDKMGLVGELINNVDDLCVEELRDCHDTCVLVEVSLKVVPLRDAGK